MTSRTWIVTTTGTRPIAAVVADLRQLGFVVGEVMATIGCVTGTATNAVAEQARRVSGVADVAPDADVGSGPPDRNPTW